MYTIIDYPNKGETYGEYIGKSPLDAAKKAFNHLGKVYNVRNENIDNLLIFTLMDLDTNETYKFIGTRIELYNPANSYQQYKDIVTHYIDEVNITK